MSRPTDTLYPYQPASTSGPWTLSRDGAEILTGTEQECWAYIHTHCAYSVDHALKYEGYQIVPGRIGP